MRILVLVAVICIVFSVMVNAERHLLAAKTCSHGSDITLKMYIDSSMPLYQNMKYELILIIKNEGEHDCDINIRTHDVDYWGAAPYVVFSAPSTGIQLSGGEEEEIKLPFRVTEDDKSLPDEYKLIVSVPFDCEYYSPEPFCFISGTIKIDEQKNPLKASCSKDSDCKSNHCVHNICRETNPYCGDGYCDSGESYLTCFDDCKKSNGEDCSANKECESTHCVHNTCRPRDPYCGDDYCDDGETYANCKIDCEDPCNNANVDLDGDGLQESDSKCPNYDDYPNDYDNDGVPTENDCDDRDYSNKKQKGDTDEDGIDNCMDKCPNEKGDTSLKGCPCEDYKNECNKCLDKKLDEYCDCNEECESNYCLSFDKTCISMPTAPTIDIKSLSATSKSPGKITIQVTNKPQNPNIIGKIELKLPEDVEVHSTVNVEDLGARGSLGFSIQSGSKDMSIEFSSNKPGDFRFSGDVYWWYEGDDENKHQQHLDKTVTIWQFCGGEYCSPDQFCGGDKKCHPKKMNCETCLNDGECSSGKCDDGKCGLKEECRRFNLDWKYIVIGLLILIIIFKK